MPEQKRGFHALEERIHQMEEEDAKQAERGGPGQATEKDTRREPAGERRGDVKK